MMGSICNKPVMPVGAYTEHVEWDKTWKQPDENRSKYDTNYPGNRYKSSNARWKTVSFLLC